ncbi:DHA2 family efflux MFS transporter permease subunit [Kocuria sp.]|jgi:EmrB/QacA subfamily drug resistance transporter|uniref:DHA2 family efflux MFS transporter permease subunit n=1 Tax=Kocuria sp. TaxID=1871328 RepID=UPI0026DEA984|nr:DHA2 family efflux MFS transporter permease subunit [Kocuria sp.]MDO5366736.1 DHA2 family efflux MFS transporter permease subunit [Kocuria sp.]
MTAADASSAARKDQKTRDVDHRNVLRALTGILAAFFMAMVTLTIIGTALPVIMADLGGDQTALSWTVTGTLLANAIFTPIFGKLADLFDKKKLLLLAILIFVLGSGAAGLSTSISMLVMARVIQGIGMGGLMALAQTILGTIIPPRERGRYAGYMGAVMAVATSLGPLLGGLIVDLFGWRWCFLIPVPLSILAAGLIIKTLHIPPREQERKPYIDLGGMVLLAIGTSALVLWVSFAGKLFDWASWQSLGLVVLTLVAAVLFVLVERRVPEPVMPLSVMTERTTVLATIAAIATGAAMFASTTYLGQYFQLGQGFTPTESGLLMLPQVVGSFVGSMVAGQLITKFGKWKRILVVGTVILGAGLFSAATLTHTTPVWLVGIFICLVGLGVGTLNQNLILAVQNTVGLKDMGAASSGVAFFRTVGGALAVSLFGAVLTRHLTSSMESFAREHNVDPSQMGDAASIDMSGLPPAVEEALRSAYGSGTGLLFLIAAIASVVTLVCVLLMREIPLRTTVDVVEVDPQTGELSVVSKRVDPVEAAGLRMQSAQTGSLPVVDPSASGLRRTPAEHAAADDAAAPAREDAPSGSRRAGRGRRAR